MRTLKILHVGNGNEKHRGARFYDVGRKIQHGLIRCYHNALFFSDRDVLRASGVAGTRLAGKERTNDRLYDVACNFAPDMMLMGHADIITNATLERIKTRFPKMRIAQFNVDPLFRPENHAAIMARIPYMDASFITTGGEVLRRYDAPHHRAYYIPNPIDPSIESARVHEMEHLPHDVFYAIRRTREDSDRIQMPRTIQRDAPELRTHFFGFDGAPELFGAAFYEALTSCAMGLNISHKTTNDPPIVAARPEELMLYSSDRLSQYIGCGLLTITEYGFGQEQLFAPDEEMIFFDDAASLIEQLRRYARDTQARQRIAHAGWHKAHSTMNASIIADYIVHMTMGEALHDVPFWADVA